MTLPHDLAGAGPDVVLLHAGVADRSMWAEHIRPLAESGFRVLAPDLPGFGEAPPAAVEDAPWRDVIETMDALGIERATLVGNSFGGAVAQRVAAEAPERVSALVLVSSLASGIEPSESLTAVWEAEGDAIDRGDTEAAVQAIVAGWTAPDAPDALRERVAAMQRRAYELQLNAPEAPEAEDPLGEDLGALEAVSAPVLLLAGEHDMEDFQASVVALAGALAQSRCVTLLGAGHLAPLERPDAFRDLLVAFLRSSSV